MSNSWVMSKVNSTDGHVQAGSFVMIPSASRTSGFDLSDSSIGDTYETADLSALVPANTTAVWGLAYMTSTSSEDKWLLLTKGYGDASTNGEEAYTHIFAADLGASGIRCGAPITIVAPGGKFEYRRYSSSWPIMAFSFVLWGYWVK